MAYQSISRNNKWINPQASDQINNMIDEIENKIVNREVTYDIPTQTVQNIEVVGASTNESFLRANHILTLSFTIKDTSSPLKIPVSVNGRWAVRFSASNGYSFPALLTDNKITFPYKPALDGPYHIYTVLVV